MLVVASDWHKNEEILLHSCPTTLLSMFSFASSFASLFPLLMTDSGCDELRCRSALAVSEPGWRAIDRAGQPAQLHSLTHYTTIDQDAVYCSTVQPKTEAVLQHIVPVLGLVTVIVLSDCPQKVVQKQFGSEAILWPAMGSSVVGLRLS